MLVCLFKISLAFADLAQDNLSFVLRTDRTFAYETRQAPLPQTSRDVVVRVVATGLCGSDVSEHARLLIGPC